MTSAPTIDLIGDDQWQRIVADLTRRVVEDDFRGHLPDQYHLDIRRSYRDDGLPLPAAR